MRRKEVASSKRTQKDAALWLLSFSDMTLTLLSFFVLFVSISRIPTKDEREVIPEVKTVTEKMTKELPVEEAPQVKIEDKKLKIEFRDGLLFEAGSSDLYQKSSSALSLVAKHLTTLPSDHTFSIAGHTDDTPIAPGGRFASNWELASARALSLMKALVKEGVPQERLFLEVYGPTKPKVSIKGLEGDALERARKVNRRVEIVVTGP